MPTTRCRTLGKTETTRARHQPGYGRGIRLRTGASDIGNPEVFGQFAHGLRPDQFVKILARKGESCIFGLGHSGFRLLGATGSRSPPPSLNSSAPPIRTDIDRSRSLNSIWDRCFAGFDCSAELTLPPLVQFVVPALPDVVIYRE